MEVDMATTESVNEIRPFHVDVPDEEPADLGPRIGAYIRP
jgi:hypothetical protein